MTTFSASVAAQADNGYEVVGVGFDDMVEALAVGNSGGFIAHAGMRFINITIPQGATINSAQITTYGEGVASSPAARWYAWDDDNAGQFTTGGDLPSNVTKTTAFTAMTMSTGNIAHDITSIVQEIINRGGWSSGNAINMIAFDNSSPTDSVAIWESYLTVGGTPAFLEIDYTTGGATPNSGFLMFM